MKNLLSIEQLSRAEMDDIFHVAALQKQNRGKHTEFPLRGKTWGLIFSKPSTRTRVSFEVGVRELGGETIFLNPNDIQLGRGELIKDTARVLARMIHGAIIRTFAQADIEEFPCQILADIFTIQEKRGSIEGKVVTFVGDGASNTARSWIFAANKMKFELRLASPAKYQPSAELLKRAGGKVVCQPNLQEAARGADVLYTDIWVSMGKEGEEARREAELGPYWINEALVRLAKPEALVMHCLPAHRGQEIDDTTLEANAQTIFDQSENRLHVQKAVLLAVTS